MNGLLAFVLAKPRTRAWLVVARHLTANVRDLRASASLTQEALAAKSDLDVKYLQQIEAGPTNITTLTLVALAMALGVAPSRLLEPATPPKRRPRGRPRSAKGSSSP